MGSGALHESYLNISSPGAQFPSADVTPSQHMQIIAKKFNFSHFSASHLGLVTKKELDKFCLIHHLSYPLGSSLNDKVKYFEASVSYASFHEALILLYILVGQLYLKLISNWLFVYYQYTRKASIPSVFISIAFFILINVCPLPFPYHVFILKLSLPFCNGF